MTFKNLIFDDEARQQLASGVNTLANAVKVTMGPRGQNVVIERPGQVPHLTKDGVSVAKAINLKDKFPNLGVQMIKEAASRTAETAGDGTTTATVLAQSIFTEGLKMIAAGYSSSEIQRGILHATEAIISELKQHALPISKTEEIVQVGTISANGDESIGRMIANAMAEVGQDGLIAVEEAKGFRTSLDIVEGLELDRGYLSPYFVNEQDKMACVLESPRVLLINKKLTSLKDILPILEKAHETQTPLFIVADDIEGEALHGLVLNSMKGVLNVCAIRAPEFGEARVNALNDLGVILGCEPITSIQTDELSSMRLEDLGRCKKIMCFKHRTVFVGSTGDEKNKQDRLSEVRNLLNDPTLEDADAASIHRRIQRLASGVAVLRVGAATEVELRERKDRVDDALAATQAAVQEGILPGGGIALVRASQNLESHLENETVDFMVGVDIVKKACQAPLRQIVSNSGGLPDIAIQTALTSEDNHGYDASNDKWVDMFTAGIIDPLKVVRSALENASSASRMLLSVGCAMTDDESADDEDKQYGIVEN